MGALPTSRDGDSLFFGKGYHYHTPEFEGFSIGAGAEFVLLYYEFNDSIGYQRVFNSLPPYLKQLALPKLREARNGYIVAPIPIGSLSLRYRIPGGNRGFVSMDQRYLLNEAKLYSFSWSKDF